MNNTTMVRKTFCASLMSSRTLSTQNVFVKHFCSNVEVNVISKENIKPSSPTPRHLRAFKFSFFCQLAPLVYVPFVLFYPTRDCHPKLNEKLSTLKFSLSNTLTSFYPLAGRIKDESFIDCNDEGASYVEAQVSCKMSEFLTHPKPDELLGLLLPCQPIYKEPAELALQVAIKVNIFSCGGIAVSIAPLHKIIDAYVLTSFLKEWAAIARGDSKKVYAHNMAASYFPPDNELSLGHDFSHLESYCNNVRKSCSRRFVFDANSISTLKNRARSDFVPNPSSYEVVCALIWKSSINASTTISGSLRPFVAQHAINIRPRMQPPMPDYSIGSLVWSAPACYTPTSDSNMELHHLVSLIRESKRKVNGDFVRKMQGKEGHTEFCKALNEVKDMYSRLQNPVSYCFSSANRLGFYDVDFGWGKPVWITTGGAAQTVFNNAFTLLDSRSGDGMEAWFIMDELETAIIESDPDFLAHATLNPSIGF